MFNFSNYLWVFNCFSRHIALGAKRIFLSPASPCLQYAHKEWQFFPSPQLGGQNHHFAQRKQNLKMCLRLLLRKDSPNQMKSQANRETTSFPAREKALGNRLIEKKLFYSPLVDIPLTTNHLIDTSSPVSHILCTPSCAAPNKAGSLDVDDRREHEAENLERKPLSNISVSNGQKLDNSCRV